MALKVSWLHGEAACQGRPTRAEQRVKKRDTPPEVHPGEGLARDGDVQLVLFAEHLYLAQGRPGGNVLGGCGLHAGQERADKKGKKHGSRVSFWSVILCARSSDGAAGLVPIASALEKNAPGYRLSWWQGGLDAQGSSRVAFVQEGAGDGVIAGERRGLCRGDVLVLPPGFDLRASGLAGLCVALPEGTDVAHLPRFLRPDHDAGFTDQPGGCAEDEKAYRRILLTWDRENGPHELRALNCHRVRMWDSLSHYHDPVNGFDEFYLVQGVEPGAQILSGPAEPIVGEEAVDGESARGLLQAMTPRVGDLIHIPRGTVHRALGGVLAQVITVPGFVPGAEIGVDHHLRRIAERLGLDATSLPYREASSMGPVVR